MNTKNQARTGTKTHITSELTSPCGVAVGSISVLVKKQDSKPVEVRQNDARYYDTGVSKQLRLHYTKSKPERDRANNMQDLRTQLAVAQSENQLSCDRLESARSAIGILQNELKTKNSRIDKLQGLTNRAQQLGLAARTQHRELLRQRS